MTTLRTTLLAATCLATAGTAHASNRTLTLPDSVVSGASLGSSSLTVDTDSSKAIVAAKAVAVLGAHDEYMTCEGGGGDDANINRTAIGVWETFVMLQFSDGQVAFRSLNGNYLQATSGGGSSVTCKGSWAHSWERWTMVKNSDKTYSFKAANGNYMTAENSGDLTSNRTASGAWEKFSIVDLGAANLDAQPELTVVYKDINNDGQAELLLKLTESDGRGFVMSDPLGMFDLLDKYGYGNSTGYDYWNALSPTQRGGLQNQVHAAGKNYGAAIDGNELHDFLSHLSGTRSYTTTETAEVIDSTALSASTCDETGTLCATAALGVTSVYIGSDGFDIDETYATASASVGGYVTVTASAADLQAAAQIDSDGFTLGGEFTLIGVETTFGKTNGTYVGISAGVSEGFFTSAAWGRNNQYGFTLDVPVIPIGIAIYIKGSDAEHLWSSVSGWTVGAANTVANGMTTAWTDSKTWVQNASDNISIALSETYHDSKSTLAKTGDDVVAGVADGTNSIVAVYAEASTAVSSAVTTMTTALSSAANAVSSWYTTADNSITSTATSAYNSVSKFFKNLF
jgi:Fascin domain